MYSYLDTSRGECAKEGRSHSSGLIGCRYKTSLPNWRRQAVDGFWIQSRIDRCTVHSVHWRLKMEMLPVVIIAGLPSQCRIASMGGGSRWHLRSLEKSSSLAVRSNDACTATKVTLVPELPDPILGRGSCLEDHVSQHCKVDRVLASSPSSFADRQKSATPRGPSVYFFGAVVDAALQSPKLQLLSLMS